MIKRIGARTIGFEEMPTIIGYASVAGKRKARDLWAIVLTN